MTTVSDGGLVVLGGLGRAVLGGTAAGGSIGKSVFCGLGGPVSGVGTVAIGKAAQLSETSEGTFDIEDTTDAALD